MPAASRDNDSPPTVKAEIEPYVTEPVHVLELQDYSGYVLKREENIKPHDRDKLYKSSNPHVLEIVRVIQSLRDQSLLDTNMIYETAPISNTFLKLLSPLLLRAMHDTITYYPNRNAYGPMILNYPFNLLFHHTEELEAYKSTNYTALSPEDVEERNRHIDCALSVVDVEHGEDMIVRKAGQEQNPPVTTFKNYWMLLKPGAFVYKRQHGVLSAYVVHDVTGGVANQKLEPYVFF